MGTSCEAHTVTVLGVELLAGCPRERSAHTKDRRWGTRWQPMGTYATNPRYRSYIQKGVSDDTDGVSDDTEGVSIYIQKGVSDDTEGVSIYIQKGVSDDIEGVSIYIQKGV